MSEKPIDSEYPQGTPEELDTEEQFLAMIDRVLRAIEAMRHAQDQEYIDVDGIQYKVMDYIPSLDETEAVVKNALEFERKNPKSTDQGKRREIFWMLMRAVTDDCENRWDQLGLDIFALEEYFCAVKIAHLRGMKYPRG